MKRTLLIIALLVVAAGVAWYLSYRKDVERVEQVEVLSPPPLPAEPEPVRHPVEDIPVPQPEPEPLEPEPEPEPLPPLAESDPEVRGQLEQLFGATAVERYLAPDFLISRAVATIDALTARRLAQPMLPIQPVPGRFKVLGEGDEAVISPENAPRYQPWVDLFQAVDTDTLVSAYLRYYPLFQEAYEEQGYPNRYFNDRLIEVLDHLLETPRPAGLVPVRQNEAVYEFVDEDLEALSAGQKALIRLGPDNQREVMERLRDFRAAIAGGAAGAG
jgi:hypothetical protein